MFQSRGAADNDSPRESFDRLFRSSTSARTAIVLCGLAFLTLAVTPASAENVILRNGRSVKADSYTIHATELRIVLRGGATMLLPAADFVRSTADEVSQQARESNALTDTLAVDFSVPRTNVALARSVAPSQDAEALLGSLN
jgi:hypothetical protein